MSNNTYQDILIPDLKSNDVGLRSNNIHIQDNDVLNTLPEKIKINTPNIVANVHELNKDKTILYIKYAVVIVIVLLLLFIVYKAYVSFNKNSKEEHTSNDDSDKWNLNTEVNKLNDLQESLLEKK